MPTERGLALFDVLQRADPALVDRGVTAQMERLPDDVLVGQQEMMGAIDAVCAQASRIIGRLQGGAASGGSALPGGTMKGGEGADRPPTPAMKRFVDSVADSKGCNCSRDMPPRAPPVAYSSISTRPTGTLFKQGRGPINRLRKLELSNRRDRGNRLRNGVRQIGLIALFRLLQAMCTPTTGQAKRIGKPPVENGRLAVRNQRPATLAKPTKARSKQAHLEAARLCAFLLATKRSRSSLEPVTAPAAGMRRQVSISTASGNVGGSNVTADKACKGMH